jgi:hypothetical protein
MPEKNQIDGKEIPASLQQIAKVVKLMDSQFRIPGTKFTFGLDPIIGLIPGLGDLIDYGVSAYLMVAMIRNGASGRAVAKMLINITIDGLIGVIPFLGRFFDIFFKANRRNLVLAIEHFEVGKHKGSAWPIVLPILMVLTVVFIIIAVLAFYILKWFLLFIGNL